MKSLLKRLAGGKKGLEALQAVLIVVVAFFIVLVLKDIGRKSCKEAGDKGGQVCEPDHCEPTPPPCPPDPCDKGK
jgi:hypothetical protein